MTIEKIIATDCWSRRGKFISVGLVNRAGTVGWGDCIGDEDVETVRDLLERRIRPTWTGRSSSAAANLLPTIEQVTLRYGLSHALCSLRAQEQAHSTAEQLQQLSGTYESANLVPLYANFQSGKLSSIPRFVAEQSAGLALSAAKQDQAARLGRRGELLQRYVRSVATTVKAASDELHDFTLVLQLNGSFSTLYDENIGQMLGAGTGLVMASKPYLSYLIDPIAADSWRLLAQLKSYFAFRGNRPLIGVTIDDWSQLESVTSEMIDVALLRPERLGGLEQVASAAQQLQAAEIRTMLLLDSAETTDNGPALLQLAQLLHCHGLICSSRELRNQLQAFQQRQRARGLLA